MDSDETDAETMARGAGISGKRFRKALRERNFPWHKPNTWMVKVGSDEHQQMKQVLMELLH
jgi:hypothetical protein